jgi:hypothetical protein
MQRQYCIWIVTPSGYRHSRCFEEVALGLREAFAALGMDAPIVTDALDVRGTAVVLKHYPVWDYSARNIETLAALGVRASLCGIGYMPGLTRIPAAAARDIDVLFIGSVNPRRGEVLHEIKAHGAAVHVAFDCYGEERDALIARAKIVLNLHFYPAKLFEIVRVSYLLANRACVVSEMGLDTELEAPFLGGIGFSSYGGLVQACLRLLGDDAARQRIAAKGFEKMRALSQVDMLRRALASA